MKAEDMRKLRVLSHFTQEEWGESLGVHKRTVAAWEQERQSIPETAALLALHVARIVRLTRDKVMEAMSAE